MIDQIRTVGRVAMHTAKRIARGYGSLLARIVVLAVIGFGTANILSQVGALFVLGGASDAGAIVMVRLPSLAPVSVDLTMLARDVLAFFGGS